MDRTVKFVLHPVRFVLYTFTYFSLLVAFLSLAGPTYVIRWILSLLQPYICPELSHLVHSRSIVLGVDGFPNNPKWNLVVWLTQDKCLNLTQFKTYFENRFVLALDSSSGRLLYPEYQQYISRWCGFYWWKWNRKFNIDHHIRLIPREHKEPMREKELLQLIKKLTGSPWYPKRSPWEFLQIPHYTHNGSNQSILIFRIHHVLGDGYFILKLLMEDISGISLEFVAKPRKFKRSFWTSIYHIIRTPHDFVRVMSEAYDQNPWHCCTDKNRLSTISLTPKISLEVIKDIRKKHGVSTSAVIIAAITGGMRRIMKAQGIQLPSEIHQTILIPIPGHPGKLRNHFIFGFLTLPILLEDPIERLLEIEENIKRLKSSYVPLMTFWKVPLVGSLWPIFMGPFVTNNLTTCLMSNFPGTPRIPHFREVIVEDMMFGAGLGPGNTGIGFTCISYVGFIRILTVADSNILHTDAHADELNVNILEEFPKF